MENLLVPTMLSITECAERTNLSKLYIRKLCWERKISFVKSGKKYLINLEKLCEYLNSDSCNQK